MTTRAHTFIGMRAETARVRGMRPGFGVITAAAPLNAAGAAATRGGAGPSSIVWGHSAQVSTAQDVLNARPASGP